MNNIELLYQLIEVTTVLGENTDPKRLTIPKIRTIFSPALRLWSEANGIFLIQKIIGQKIHFKCRDHKLVIRACEDQLLVEWASTISLDGMEMSVWLQSEAASNQGVNPKIDSENAVVNLDSAAFFDQKLMYLNGKFLTRKEIIHYVANRMGGSHPISQEEKEKDKKFGEFRRLLGFTTNGNNVKILKGSDMDNLREHELDGAVAADPFLLYVADAAFRFVDELNESLPFLQSKLAELKNEVQSPKI